MDNRYGYQLCLVYQVKDQGNQDIQETLPLHEDICVFDTNKKPKSHIGDSETNEVGQFGDTLAQLSGSVLPSDLSADVKQSFTVKGYKNPIRVNCLHYSSNDVTITDYTAKPDKCNPENKPCK